jgi:2-methylcitrate dehydratase
MVAVPLIFGELNADSYSDTVAADPRIDSLREKMTVVENESFTRDYFDPGKRGIGNSVQVFFSDGSSSDLVEVSYPIGHRRRREEGIPVLISKFQRAVADHYSTEKSRVIDEACALQDQLESMTVPDFVDAWVS